MQRISAPLNKREIEKLKAGSQVSLSGIIYTARDQAHKRLVEAINSGRKLPIELKNATIYYCGPTAKPKGKIIGSCGPTTSLRMDAFTPVLLRAGLKAMIGKGGRSREVIAAIKKYKAAYFLAYAGCGALLAQYVKQAAVVAYEDLGPEAIYRLEVKDFPLIVAVDSRGRSIYPLQKTRK